MSVKKTIAIVGATEKEGTEITNQFARTDYRLLLVSNDTNQLTQLLKNITAKKPTAEIDTIVCIKDGCWEADIIILAVAPSEENKVAELIKEVATQKIVVTISDVKNVNNDLQKILPYSKMVNVSIGFQSKEIFITGEDNEANEEVLTAFNHAGYHTTITQSLNHPIIKSLNN
jgi:hypothetical protein